jgi:hypothetical protein
LPAVSFTPPLFDLFRPSVPFPLPVLAVTVHVAVGAMPDTDVIAGEPVNPVFTTEKFDASTPLTGSLNVTVHETLDAAVGDEPASAIDVNVGPTWSTE